MMRYYRVYSISIILCWTKFGLADNTKIPQTTQSTTRIISTSAAIKHPAPPSYIPCKWTDLQCKFSNSTVDGRSRNCYDNDGYGDYYSCTRVCRPNCIDDRCLGLCFEFARQCIPPPTDPPLPSPTPTTLSESTTSTTKVLTTINDTGPSNQANQSDHSELKPKFESNGTDGGHRETLYLTLLIVASVLLIIGAVVITVLAVCLCKYRMRSIPSRSRKSSTSSDEESGVHEDPTRKGKYDSVSYHPGRNETESDSSEPGPSLSIVDEANMSAIGNFCRSNSQQSTRSKSGDHEKSNSKSDVKPRRQSTSSLSRILRRSSSQSNEETKELLSTDSDTEGVDTKNKLEGESQSRPKFATRDQRRPLRPPFRQRRRIHSEGGIPDSPPIFKPSVVEPNLGPIDSDCEPAEL